MGINNLNHLSKWTLLILFIIAPVKSLAGDISVAVYPTPSDDTLKGFSKKVGSDDIGLGVSNKDHVWHLTTPEFVFHVVVPNPERATTAAKSLYKSTDISMTIWKPDRGAKHDELVLDATPIYGLEDAIGKSLIGGLDVGIDYFDYSIVYPDEPTTEVRRLVLVTVATQSTSFAFATKASVQYAGPGKLSDVAMKPRSLASENVEWLVLPSADDNNTYITTSYLNARFLIEGALPEGIFDQLQLIKDPLSKYDGWATSFVLGIGATKSP